MFSHPIGSNQRISAGLVFLGALVTIATAWGFQLIGGYLPCELCLQQRIPYYVGVPLAAVVLGLAWAGGSAVLVRLGLIAFGLVMLSGLGLAVYQSGAEWGFWLGPQNCGGQSQQTNDVSGLISSLRKTKIVSCNFASWRMLGLSFAGWNGVASLGLIVVALWGAIARPQRSTEAAA